MRKAIKFAVLSGVALSLSATSALAVEWNVSVWGKRRAFTEHIEKMAEILKEKSNGDFTLNISYGGLSKAKENLDGISIGAFEMAQFCAGYHPDKNPTLTVLELPFLGVSNLKEEVAVSNAVYADPATQKDMERWHAKLLMPSPMPQYNLVGKGEPRDTVAKMKGMRVRATGGIGEAFKAIGAVPTSVTASEAYQALESGVVDTVAFAPHAHLSFRTIDVANWWTENLNPGTVNCPVVVNIDAYNKLSDENRAILDAAVEPSIQHYLDNYGELMKKWDGILKEKKVQVVHISDEEIAKFKEAGGKPVQDAWIKEVGAQGIPAQHLFDLVQQTLGKSGSSN